MIAGEVRMRPSLFGYHCYLLTGGRLYEGFGTTMEAAYEAFIQHGSEVLAEEQGLSHFEDRAFICNAHKSHARQKARQEQAEANAAVLNPPWWKKLLRSLLP